MTSEVDICNLALSHLGDEAAVTNLSPPEGSIQAAHCARFYPIARDTLLEAHTWSFATKRVALAIVGSGFPEWDYAYAEPADSLNIIAVLPPDATDDYSQGVASVPVAASGSYTPKPFSCEMDSSGQSVIYSDQPDAVLRYTYSATDTTKYSPLFVLALSWHLASMLAGPILKGDAGAAEAKRCAAMAKAIMADATESDAGQRRIAPEHRVGWIGGR